MNDKTANTLLGCLVWFLAIVLITSCILPTSFGIGGFTSWSQSAIAFTGNFVCPEGTTPQKYTYETTITDEWGDEEPAIGAGLHCIDQNGRVVKDDRFVSFFVWSGLFVLVGLIVSGVILLVLEPTIDKIIKRIVKSRHTQDMATNIPPL